MNSNPAQLWTLRKLVDNTPIWTPVCPLCYFFGLIQIELNGRSKLKAPLPCGPDPGPTGSTLPLPSASVLWKQVRSNDITVVVREHPESCVVDHWFPLHSVVLVIQLLYNIVTICAEDMKTGSPWRTGSRYRIASPGTTRLQEFRVLFLLVFIFFWWESPADESW